VKEAARVAAEVGVNNADLLVFANRESGRVVLTEKAVAGEYEVSYVAGQYYPTEFRHAAANVIEAATQRRLTVLRLSYDQRAELQA
jgi:hypothetical protein